MDQEKIIAAIERLEQWIEQHNADVDHGAFLTAVDALVTRCFVGKRCPATLFRTGVVALDVVCALVGRHVNLTIGYSRLPGAADWRKWHDTSESEECDGYYRSDREDFHADG